MTTVLLSKWTNTLCACRSRAWIRAWNFEPQPYIIFVHNFPYQGFLPVWHHIFLSTLQFCLQGPFSYLSAVASWYGILWICRLLLCQKLWDLTMAGDWSESVRGSWCRKIAGKKWQNSTWCRDAHTALSSAAKQFWAQSGKKLYLVQWHFRWWVKHCLHDAILGRKRPTVLAGSVGNQWRELGSLRKVGCTLCPPIGNLTHVRWAKVSCHRATSAFRKGHPWKCVLIMLIMLIFNFGSCKIWPTRPSC